MEISAAYGSSAIVALRYCRRADIEVPDAELAGPGVGGPARGAQSGTGVAESTGIVQSCPVITSRVDKDGSHWFKPVGAESRQ